MNKVDRTDSRDLIVVVADLDAEETVKALLDRAKSLQIRPIRFTVDRYVKRDSGCRGTSHDYLRPFINHFDYAIVLFDRHGSGQDADPREAIEMGVEEQLERNGWKGRSAAIVLDPELEIWVWSDSSEVDEVLGWRGQAPPLREWLVTKKFRDVETAKPPDPKEAMKQALRSVGKKPSASQFRELAEKVGVGRCEDPAFLKFKQTLQTWFPE